MQLDPRFFPKFWIGHSNKMLLWWNQKRRLDSKRVGQAQRWANDAFHTCNINLIFQPWNYRQDKFLLSLGQGSIPKISVLNFFWQIDLNCPLGDWMNSALRTNEKVSDGCGSRVSTATWGSGPDLDTRTSPALSSTSHQPSITKNLSPATSNERGCLLLLFWILQVL